jgi:hypothetical protein
MRRGRSASRSARCSRPWRCGPGPGRRWWSFAPGVGWTSTWPARRSVIAGPVWPARRSLAGTPRLQAGCPATAWGATACAGPCRSGGAGPRHRDVRGRHPDRVGQDAAPGAVRERGVHDRVAGQGTGPGQRRSDLVGGGQPSRPWQAANSQRRDGLLRTVPGGGRSSFIRLLARAE